MSKKTTSNGLSYGRGYVYSIQYHIVFCTKYRKPVLDDTLQAECNEMIRQISRDYGFTVLAVEAVQDHIHLLIDCKPQFFIPDMVKIIKGNLARWLFIRHPELKEKLWGGHLWNPSYCITTVSDRTQDLIMEYINTQKEA